MNRDARDEFRSHRQQPDRRGRVPDRPAAPGASSCWPCSRCWRWPGSPSANGRARPPTRPAPAFAPGRRAVPGGGCCGSASASSGSSTGCCRPSRPWPLGLPVPGHPARRGQLARLGAARRQLGRHQLVLPPDPGRRRRGLDSGRHRRLADRRAAGAVVAAGRAGQRRLGPGRLGVRRGLRRHLRARPDLAVRRARARRCSTARPGCWSRCRSGLAGAAAGPAAPGRARRCSSLGMAVLQAWPGRGFWQGAAARPAGHARRHGPVDGRDPAAGVSCPAGVGGFGSFTRRTASR